MRPAISSAFLERIKRAKISFTPAIPKEDACARDPVVIVGWTGSRLKNLQHYGNIYSERGHDVLAYAPSIPDIWFQHRAQRITKDLLDAASDLPSMTQERSLILHMASGAPYIFFPSALKDD